VPALTPFIGRDREVELADAALQAAIGGRTALLALAGEPGIGKTRLAEEIAARASRHGAVVAWGRCWESGGARAFWPWVRLYRTYVRDADPEGMRTIVAPAWKEMRRIAPDLVDGPGNDEPDPASYAMESEHARLVVFDAVAGCLARATDRQPLVLVLDDLHAADLPSLLLLRFVVDALRDRPLLIVVTHREAELRHRPDVAGVIGDVVRRGIGLPLRGLGDAEIERLVVETVGVDVGPSTVAALRMMTGGNPFLLGEVARVLVAERQIDRVARAGATVLPVQARELIRRRLDLLSAETRDALRVAALIGQEFGIPILQSVLRTGDGDVLDHLRTAVADGLVTIACSTGTRYRFAHSLVREALGEELSAAERLVVHRQIGEAFETLHRPHLEPHLAQLAHHFGRAAAGGTWLQAVRYAAAAGDQALRALAYEEAARHYEAALAALEFAAPPALERRAELLLQLGTCRAKSADREGTERAFGEAATLARALGRPDVLGRAALGFAPWTAYGRAKHDAPGALEEALTQLPTIDSPLRAELLARLAHVLEPSAAVPRQRVISLSREATAMARRLGDERSLARALYVARWVDWDPASFSERARVSEEMHAIARRLGDRELGAHAAEWRVVDAFERGDAVGVDAAVRGQAALAAALRQPEHQWWASVWHALRAILEGPSREAEARVGAALEFGALLDPDNTFLVGHLQLSQILLDRGDVEGPLRALESVLAARREVFEGDPYLSCRRAETLMELGREAEARQEYERLAADGFAAVGRDMRYAVNLASLAVTCAALGDRRRAAVLYERLQPASGRNLLFGPALLTSGPAARYLGLLAATRGRIEVARRHFEEATAAGARLGWATLVARTQCDHAATLLRRGRRDDAAMAARLLDAAMGGAERLGMERVLARARALRERCVAPAAAPVPASDGRLWRREGEYWSITYEGVTSRLRHTSGLAYLGELVQAPAREIHVLELLAATRPGLPGPMAGDQAELAPGLADAEDETLDGRARAAYRRRLGEIEAELARAEAANDPGGAARARAEREAVEAELAKAVGLNGRVRRTCGRAERARLNVTRAIRSAIMRIDASNVKLGRHLMRSVRTGMHCMYLPDAQQAGGWVVVTTR
jgi:hypothetical protein